MCISLCFIVCSLLLSLLDSVLFVAYFTTCRYTYTMPFCCWLTSNVFSFNVCVSFSIFKHSVPSPELLVSLERAEYEVREEDAGHLAVCVVVQSGALDGSVGASVRVSVPTTEGNTATVQSELYTISCSICQKLGIEFVYLLSTQMH